MLCYYRERDNFSNSIDKFQIGSQCVNCNGFSLVHTERVQENKKVPTEDDDHS